MTYFVSHVFLYSNFNIILNHFFVSNIDRFTISLEDFTARFTLLAILFLLGGWIFFEIRYLQGILARAARYVYIFRNCLQCDMYRLFFFLIKIRATHPGKNSTIRGNFFVTYRAVDTYYVDMSSRSQPRTGSQQQKDVSLNF
jgi:hypothetical protein